MGKLTTATVVLALALPAPAAAESIAVPPGNSEADQYFETVPGLVNPRSRDSERSAEDAVREGRLSPTTARTLEERGEAGAALADVVAQTAPVAPGGVGGYGSSDREPGAGPTTPGTSDVALLSPPEEQGLGLLFPLIAVAIAAGAAGYALSQWRHTRLSRPPSG